jgi:hypothetical protein
VKAGLIVTTGANANITQRPASHCAERQTFRTKDATTRAFLPGNVSLACRSARNSPRC